MKVIRKTNTAPFLFKEGYFFEKIFKYLKIKKNITINTKHNPRYFLVIGREKIIEKICLSRKKKLLKNKRLFTVSSGDPVCPPVTGKLPAAKLRKWDPLKWYKIGAAPARNKNTPLKIFFFFIFFTLLEHI